MTDTLQLLREVAALETEAGPVVPGLRGQCWRNPNQHSNLQSLRPMGAEYLTCGICGTVGYGTGYVVVVDLGRVLAAIRDAEGTYSLSRFALGDSAMVHIKEAPSRRVQPKERLRGLDAIAVALHRATVAA